MCSVKLAGAANYLRSIPVSPNLTSALRYKVMTPELEGLSPKTSRFWIPRVFSENLNPKA